MYNRIIIVDDRIGDKSLFSKIEKTYTIEDNQIKESSVCENDNVSHSDICVKIILKYAPDVKIINVVVKGNWEVGKIDDFILALDLCRHIDADLVSMSLGTTKRKKLNKMKKLVKDITKHKIVVASKSNDMKKTYPAAFNNVMECYYKDKKRFVNDCEFKNESIKNELYIRDNRGKLCILPYCNSYLTAHISGIVFKELETTNNDFGKN